ncbi:MAG: molybdopterin molybdotransferase MoeA [Alphaproteobacteria bacterium]
MVQLSNDHFAIKRKQAGKYQPNGLINLSTALARLEKKFQKSLGKKPIAHIIKKNILQSIGMVSAENVIAKNPVPHFANSAVDGYAFCFADIVKLAKTQKPISLPIAGSHVAKAQTTKTILQKNTAIEIFTGAALPKNADCVIMKEDIVVKNHSIILPNNISEKFIATTNVRQIGDDVGKKQLLLKQGDTITALHIGLLAAQNIKQVMVFQPLTIAVFSSGNEIKSSGKLYIGEMFDSNRPSIISLLNTWGYRVIDGGHIIDDKKIMAKKLSRFAKISDVIITTGGMAVGKYDFTAMLLKKSAMEFYGIAMKPGRPIGFSHINGKQWLALPGNPVAVMMGLFFLIKPFLGLLQGRGKIILPDSHQVIANFDMKKKLGRLEFVRVTWQKKNGKYLATKIAKSGSAVLSSLAMADGIVAIDENITSIAIGDSLTAYSLKELLQP